MHAYSQYLQRLAKEIDRRIIEVIARPVRPVRPVLNSQEPALAFQLTRDLLGDQLFTTLDTIAGPDTPAYEGDWIVVSGNLRTVLTDADFKATYVAATAATTATTTTTTDKPDIWGVPNESILPS